MGRRIFLIVLDSFGIGGAPDADEYGDAGSDTLAAIAKSPRFFAPTMSRLGLYNIAGVQAGRPEPCPEGAYGRLQEASRGKDTTIGHWELAGAESQQAMPVFLNGLPREFIEEFERRTGRSTLVNRAYSGTEVIRDYGEEQMHTGALIVYTSADSVFQIAANEQIIPLNELYKCCEIAREMLKGELAVGRVIARPFTGSSAAEFVRTANRHDYSLEPPAPTVLDALAKAGRDVIGVGKIHDIFAGRGITKSIKTASNAEGMQTAYRLAQQDFNGLAFINLVEFDMVYGHRNDVDGYAQAISEFDTALPKLMELLKKDDVLMLTADHGCDPSTISTDHSRECVPLLVWGQGVRAGVDLGSLISFAHVANIVAAYFGLPAAYPGENLWPLISEG